MPAPLPPDLDLRPLVMRLSEADAKLSELSGIGRLVPNPHLLIAPYLNREAVASSQIEGTQAGLSELLIDEVAPEQTSDERDVLEVRNYIAAMQLGLQVLNELPIAGRLVRRMHAVLLDGVRGQERSPGEFRRSQNWIRGTGPTDAHFVPPPPDRLADCISDWEKFVNRRDVLPPLVQCAVMHAVFETIHPFLDGNGRIGRLLITLFLIERGRLGAPLLYLSSFIERTKDVYYERLQRIRTHGEWNAWIDYFLAGVIDTCTQAIEQSAALLSLRDALRDRVRSKPQALQLIDRLFDNPYTTIARAAKQLDASVPTATRAIGVLVAEGILHQADDRKWGRTWLAEPILRALEGRRG